ncbi:hypothetical protein AURDEDRAFT_125038 [Auricularia subglabra TFB-10046 SS5]|nr:hypothetical protein AURDEDRAFT_125038 [Auricularia subglabra TFB-10046 SS5]
MNIPSGIEDSIGSLAVYLGDRVSLEVAVLGTVLAVCRNLCTLYVTVTGRSVEDLASHLPNALPSLHTLSLAVHQAHERDDLAALLRLMPNLQNVYQLPGIRPAPLEDADLPFLRLEHCWIISWHCAALPLLVSHHWTARTVLLWCTQSTLDKLTDVDWSAADPLRDTVSLRVTITVPRARPALAFITACPALRHIDLRADGAIIASELPGVLEESLCLRDIELHFSGEEVPARCFESVAQTLRDRAPRTLRSLKVYHHAPIPDFHLLLAFFSARRVLRSERRMIPGAARETT